MKCNFCGKDIERGTGKMYIKKDGKVMYFCSMKCEKNTLKLKRKPRETTWTAEYAKVKATLLGAKKDSAKKVKAKK